MLLPTRVDLLLAWISAISLAGAHIGEMNFSATEVGVLLLVESLTREHMAIRDCLIIILFFPNNEDKNSERKSTNKLASAS